MKLNKIDEVETVRIHFLSDVLICCHPKILLSWQRDVTTFPLYSHLITNDLKCAQTATNLRNGWHFAIWAGNSVENINPTIHSASIPSVAWIKSPASRTSVFFECEHPIIDKLTVITEPAVANTWLSHFWQFSNVNFLCIPQSRSFPGKWRGQSVKLVFDLKRGLRLYSSTDRVCIFVCHFLQLMRNVINGCIVSPNIQGMIDFWQERMS